MNRNISITVVLYELYIWCFQLYFEISQTDKLEEKFRSIVAEFLTEGVSYGLMIAMVLHFLCSIKFKSHLLCELMLMPITSPSFKK